MAKLQGRNCKLYDGSTLIPTENWSLDENMTLVETSEQGDTGEEFTSTIMTGSVTFDGFFDPLDASHAGCITKLRAGTPITVTGIFSGTKGSGSAVGISGTIVLEKFTRTTSKKDMVKFSASAKISGVLTDASNL